jgi:hypothetical protein
MVFKSNFVVLAYAKKKIVNSQIYRRIKINIQIIGACKKKLEKTEGAIKNVQSRDTDNIGHTRHRTNKC